MNISDLLCDLYDIRRMAELEGFGNLPKDNEGTETTIFECLDNCITQLLESKEQNETFNSIYKRSTSNSSSIFTTIIKICR